MQSAKCRDSLQGPLGGFRSPHTSSLTAVLHCRDVQWNVRGQLHWCASSCLSTAVECICDLAQIDVIMRETCGNQDLPKVTGTGDALDPYPSAMRVHMLSCCGAYVVLFAFLSVAAPAQNPAPQHPRREGAPRRSITTMQPRKFDRTLSFMRERNARQYAIDPSKGVGEASSVSIGAIEPRITIHVKTEATWSSCSFMEGPAT